MEVQINRYKVCISYRHSTDAYKRKQLNFRAQKWPSSPKIYRPTNKFGITNKSKLNPKWSTTTSANAVAQRACNSHELRLTSIPVRKHPQKGCQPPNSDLRHMSKTWTCRFITNEGRAGETPMRRRRGQFSQIQNILCRSPAKVAFNPPFDKNV